MDARRFDGIVRGFARGRSRRTMLRGLTGLAAGGLLTRTATVRADGEGDGTDTGTGGTAHGVCVPIARPVSALAAIKPPYPALIVVGTCETPDNESTLSLFDVTADNPPVGAATAATVYQSATTVRIGLDDLITQTHSIVVFAGADDDTVIACGEIGGLRTGDDLTVGIRERNQSDHTGIGWLRGSADSTLVYVFLGRGLSTVETASATNGSTVVTTADVNLRAEPSEDADIVAVLAEGTQLTVTGTASDEWLPVENPETGDTGFVSAQYVALVG